MSPEEFFKAMMPYALSVSQQTGVDPRIVIAQSAIETGYGKHAPGNNFFGIKGSGGGTYKTTEFGPNGAYQINDSFRGYNSMADSAADYAKFINTNPRYADFRSAQGLDAQLAALQKSGYATDPNYSAKVGSVAKNITIDPNATGAQVASAPAPSTTVPANPQQTMLQRLQSGTPAPWTQKLGIAPTTANSFANIGGLLSAIAGASQQQAAPQIQPYEHRADDPNKYKDLFAGLLA